MQIPAVVPVTVPAADPDVPKPPPRNKIVKYLIVATCVILIIGGVGSLISSILTFFLAPITTVLSLYLFLFGLIGAAGEMGLAVALKYFGFFADWLGEAVFFVFVGTIGLSFWTDSILAFVTGIISTCAGVLCVIDHFVISRKLIQRGANTAAPTQVQVQVQA